MAGDTLADWTPTILTKWLRDLFQNSPPDFLPNLNAENITANTQLTIKDKLVVPTPSWRLVGTTGQPAFQNGWVNYGSNFAPLSFWKDPMGWVSIRGLIKSGTTAAVTTVFTLPPGFRPLYNEVFPVDIDPQVHGRVDVYADGRVAVIVSSATYTSLSGIRFRTS